MDFAGAMDSKPAAGLDLQKPVSLPPKAKLWGIFSSSDAHPVCFDQDVACNWMGYSSESAGLRAMLRAMENDEFKGEVREEEYTSPAGEQKTRYFLTVNGVKKLGMLARTTAGEAIRDHFVRAETEWQLATTAGPLQIEGGHLMAIEEQRTRQEMYRLEQAKIQQQADIEKTRIKASAEQEKEITKRLNSDKLLEKAKIESEEETKRALEKARADLERAQLEAETSLKIDASKNQRAKQADLTKRKELRLEEMRLKFEMAGGNPSKRPKTSIFDDEDEPEDDTAEAVTIDQLFDSFLEERCTVGPMEKVGSKLLADAFKSYAGDKINHRNAVGMFVSRGFNKKAMRLNGSMKNGFEGISLNE